MKSTQWIWFDMDGTIADLYAVEGWLPMLRAYEVTPYAQAKPMLHFASFARQLNTLQRKGFKLGIVSWLSKCGNADYDARVTDTKKAWLAERLPSVHWDSVTVVAHGTPKHELAQGFFFDDEEHNRIEWERNRAGVAFEPTAITDVLKELNKLVA